MTTTKENSSSLNSTNIRLLKPQINFLENLLNDNLTTFAALQKQTVTYISFKPKKIAYNPRFRRYHEV